MDLRWLGLYCSKQKFFYIIGMTVDNAERIVKKKGYTLRIVNINNHSVLDYKEDFFKNRINIYIETPISISHKFMNEHSIISRIDGIY